MADFDVWFKSNDDPGIDIITIRDRIGIAIEALYSEDVYWATGASGCSYECEAVWGSFNASKSGSEFYVKASGRLNIYDVIGLSVVLETVFENDAYPFRVYYMGKELGYDLTKQTLCKSLKISEDWYMEIWEQDVAPALDRL